MASATAQRLDSRETLFIATVAPRRRSIEFELSISHLGPQADKEPQLIVHAAEA
jgi:hypothetical protein